MVKEDGVTATATLLVMVGGGGLELPPQPVRRAHTKTATRLPMWRGFPFAKLRAGFRLSNLGPILMRANLRPSLSDGNAARIHRNPTLNFHFNRRAHFKPDV